MDKGLRVAGLAIHTCTHIRLAVKPGQCIGITGPSGAGKTLLLRALADLDPHDGQVWLGDEASTDMPAPQWRRQVGLLPAESAWWHDTVGPHLPGVPEPALVDLGFDLRVLDWQVSRLSSGERQRLALLRLLGHRPRVLLLDEPTANLDSQNTARVEALLGRYQSDRPAAIIWVSHDLDQLQRLCRAVYTFHAKQFECMEYDLTQDREG